MDFKGICSLGCSLLTCSLATAGTMGPITAPPGYHPIISVQGGYSSNNLNRSSQSYLNNSSDLFVYANRGNATNTGFVGAFAGVELPWVTHPGVMVQTGVEYDYFGSADTHGINTVGIEPQLNTTYAYQYRVQTQQVLGILKLLTTVYGRFYPYGEVGLGAAFNQADRYRAYTNETGSLNLTPYFNSKTNSQFSYSLGLGIDAQVQEHIRVGLGYRYSYFGTPSLGSGAVIYNNYSYPVPFTLNKSNAYANQLLARISYIV